MDCTACKRHAFCANVGLEGFGDATSDVLIVGSAPTSRDDLAGAPFSGASGALLRGILTDAGFDPAKVRYTTAVKCGANWPASSGEVDSCRQHLIDEVQRQRPQAIIALGDTALRALTKQAGLRHKRGTNYKLHAAFGCGDEEIVWPTYALALVNSTPQVRNVIVSDFRRVADRMKPAESLPWQWWRGQDIPPGACGFDIETDYDRATKTGGETMIQCAVATRETIYVAYGSIQSAKLASKLSNAHLVFTLNGWDFDNPKCRALNIAVPDGIDVMALAYLDDETQPLGLENLAVKYLKVRGWKDLREATPGTPEFALYNAKDAYYTLMLGLSLTEKLGPRAKIVEQIMLPARLALDACTKRGIPINAKAVATADKLYQTNIAIASEQVKQLAGFSDHNPNSTREVTAILRSHGVDLPLTPSGEGATSKKYLEQVNSPYTEALLRYREARKALSTYVDPYRKVVSLGDGKVHPTYTIWRTVTNRTSARNPNIQNLPRNLKQFFHATSVDYSSIEFRIAAWVAKETGILSRYQKDPHWDPHTFFASLFYDIPEEQVTKSQRQVAKSANFSQLYLGNGFTLKNYAQGMGITLTTSQCTAIHKKWHAAFPAFAQFYLETYWELMANGYVETATGYRRHYGDPRLLTSTKRASALRECVNVKVQTLAAHVALIGLSCCHLERLPVCGFIHDANLFDFHSKQNAIDSMEIINYAMTVHPINVLREEFDINLDVPLTVEATYNNESVPFYRTPTLTAI